MAISTVQQLLDANPAVSDITLSQIFHFISFVSRLKDDILLTQPAHWSATVPPDILPPSVIEFLSDGCDLAQEKVETLWGILKSNIWLDAGAYQDCSAAAFAKHGHVRGLAFCTLFPPQHHCIAADCPRSARGLLMKKSESRNAVVYTLDSGPQPAYSVHLYCPGE